MERRIVHAGGGVGQRLSTVYQKGRDRQNSGPLPQFNAFVGALHHIFVRPTQRRAVTFQKKPRPRVLFHFQGDLTAPCTLHNAAMSQWDWFQRRGFIHPFKLRRFEALTAGRLVVVLMRCEVALGSFHRNGRFRQSGRRQQLCGSCAPLRNVSRHGEQARPDARRASWRPAP